MSKSSLWLVLAAGCLAIVPSDAPADTASKVGGGESHTCALTAVGGVVCWGSNGWGQLGDGTITDRPTPTPVLGLTSGVTAVAVGGSHTCALTSSGGVVCWGRNYEGQLGDGSAAIQQNAPTAVVGLSTGVAAIAAGASHACALKSPDGAVVCWGDNTYGQLGDGTTTTRRVPMPVYGLTSGAAAVAAGYAHTCVLTNGAAAKCWGDNSYGQLGDGTTVSRYVPTDVSGLANGVGTIAPGVDHTCAVTVLGAALCWGGNSNGQLGDGTTTGRRTPTAVSGGLIGVAELAAGNSFTCARGAGGDVQCWGRNLSGQVGDGTLADRWKPTAVVGLQGNATAVGAGWNHACAVTLGGSVRCWGTNLEGRLGDGTVTRRLTSAASPGLASGVVAVSPGSFHTCAVTTNGAALCWGNNSGGKLGDGTNSSRSAPTGVTGLSSGVTAIRAGGGHTCALIAGGGVSCWGNNWAGQVGDGTLVDRSTPTPVGGLDSGIAGIAVGGAFSCALTSGGAVVCWGRNDLGQLGDGTTVDRRVPTPVSGLSGGVKTIVAGYSHACALTAANAVVCWGSNYQGGIGDGTTVDRWTPTAVSGLSSGVASITAGGYHSCAVTTAGAGKCWGSNGNGELGDGSLVSRSTPVPIVGLDEGIAAVSAGESHTCAITTAGNVACWGNNYNGQLGDGTRSYRPVPTLVPGLAAGTVSVAAGGYHTCVLTSAGAVSCWGMDQAGQLGLGTRVQASTPVSVYGFGGAIGESTVSPARGLTSGGTAVTITGAYFLQGATVAVGGVAATAVTVATPETIMATTSAHAAGRVDVVVTNPDSTQATLADGFLYTGAGVDFTGDLSADILWRHGTQGDLWLWPMSAAARTAETYVRTVADLDWEIRGQGDQDGDGTADILWRNKTTGMIYYWPMSAGAPTAETYVATVDTAYDIVGTGDFNGDGRSDILWRNTTMGDVWVWLMNGATPLAEVYVDTVDPAYAVKGVGDLDGDAKADIVWHGAAGDVWVWLMNATTRLSQTYVGTVSDTDYQIQQVADFDGNGKSDVLWWNAVQGDVWIWLMNGATRLSETYVGTVPDTNYRIVGAGDYDGNTKADILWRNVSAGDVWVWLMNGTTKRSENYVGTVPDTGYQIVNAR